MELTLAALDGYLVALATLLDRHGATVDVEDGDVLLVDHSPSGLAVLGLRGFLPAHRRDRGSVLTIRERWRPKGDGFERVAYAYELLDHERDFRRALHLHDRDWFVARFQVVVHEHCERPVGVAPCPHHEGRPVRDAFEAVERLMAAWVDPEPHDCARLPCLE